MPALVVSLVHPMLDQLSLYLICVVEDNEEDLLGDACLRMPS